MCGQQLMPHSFQKTMFADCFFPPSLVADFQLQLPYNFDMQALLPRGELEYEFTDIGFCQATSSQQPIKTLCRLQPWLLPDA